MGDKPKRVELGRKHCSHCGLDDVEALGCRNDADFCVSGFLPDPPVKRGKIPDVINFKSITKRMQKIHDQKKKEQ